MGWLIIHELEVKNQSNHLRGGSGDCILDQVYFIHFSGISTNLRLLRASLKMKISCKITPGWFLLSEERMRLKYPTTS
jgi:hypothetical protein